MEPKHYRASHLEYLDGLPTWAREIHLFWFGPKDVTDDNYVHLFARWYRGGPALDEEILARFGPRVEEVVADHTANTFARWRQGPRADMALVLLLDQMTRNMYRGDARMFATDAIAQDLVLAMLDDGHYEALTHIERLFCCVALEHAEDVERVRRSATLMAALAEDAPLPQRKRFVSMCHYNQQHLTIIEAFGRYPHRNALLGRDTTQEEAAFLAETNYRFMRSVKKGYR